MANKRPWQTGKGYDPDKTCGDYGGKTSLGTPCTQPAGWKSEETDDGRCHQHDRAADDYKRSTKARIVELLPAVGNWQQVCKDVGVTARTLFEWRKADGAFRDAVDAIIEARDKDRAAQVEDHVFNRILTDKASPAEIIFYLKNRDRDRWKDNYESPAERQAARQPLANVDDPKRTLSTKLKNMARRAAESTRAVNEHSEQNATDASAVADKIRKATEGKGAPDDSDGE